MEQCQASFKRSLVCGYALALRHPVSFKIAFAMQKMCVRILWNWPIFKVIKVPASHGKDLLEIHFDIEANIVC